MRWIRRVSMPVVALGVTAFLLAASLVVVGVSFTISDINPDLALTLHTGNSRALISRAERALAATPPALEDARRNVMAALGHDPLAPRAHRILARVAQLQGRHNEADHLWMIGARTLRDPLSQGMMFARAAQRRDWDEALNRIDLIYRTQPRSWEQINQGVIAMLTQEDFSIALAERLGVNPAWRDNLLHRIIRELDPEALVTFVAIAGEQGLVLSDREFAVYLARLVETRRYATARAAFVARLPAERRASELFYNGRFEHQLTNLPFDWIFTPAPNALARVVEDDDGKALLIDFFGGRAQFRHVNHLLTLPAGTYRLGGEVQTRQFRNERGIGWRIYCLEGASEPIATTPLITAAPDWTPFAVEFRVPDICPLQNLVLEIPSRFLTDQEAAGTVVFRGLAIDAVGQ